MRKAVILIPGIKGIKLVDSNTIDNEVVWQDMRYNFEDFSKTELTFEHNDQYFDENFSAIVKPSHLEPLAYKEFWNRLNPDYDYKFVFPYDWRLPNEINGKRLKSFINNLIKRSKAKDGEEMIFDFVTHSMGNMPLRYYIKDNGMEHINKIVFVTPPFKGAADAISALTIGRGLFFNKEDIRKVARSLPALFELLPTYENYAIDSENGLAIDLWDENNWQKNLVTVGDNLDKNRSIKKFISNLKKTKVRINELEEWKSNLTPEEKNRILVLVKTDFETLTDIVIEKRPTDGNPENYFDFDLSLESKEGDGVVPNVSSCCYYDEFATYCFKNRKFQDDFKHPFILKDNRVQRVVNSFLNSDLGTSAYNHNLLGRTVHRVTNLIPVEIEEHGITYKTWHIKY